MVLIILRLLYIFEVTFLNSDKKQSEAKAADCIKLCEKYSSPRFGAFFTEEEQAACSGLCAPGVTTLFFGGYDGARRRLFAAIPEWSDPEEAEYPVAIVSIEKKYPKELSHRDYLGTILSLGIERDAVGDILVHEQGAYVFVLCSVCDTLLFGIEKIANCGVRLRRVALEDIEIPEQEFDDLFCIAASMRLDAVLAGATKLSRAKAADLIRSGAVSLNHTPASDSSKSVSEGDVLSVRGFGRYIIHSTEGRTGSGRLHVHIKKFR